MKLFKKNRNTKKKEARNKFAKKLISLFFRGNINLQKGSYSTKEDVKNLRKEVMKYDFSSL